MKYLVMKIAGRFTFYLKPIKNCLLFLFSEIEGFWIYFRALLLPL
jgi:hypothetical protein